MNNQKKNTSQKRSKKNSKERSKELEKRTLKFAVRIIKLASELPDNEVGKIVKYQIIKSGTSVGANYRFKQYSFKIEIWFNQKTASIWEILRKGNRKAHCYLHHQNA